MSMGMGMGSGMGSGMGMGTSQARGTFVQEESGFEGFDRRVLLRLLGYLARDRRRLLIAIATVLVVAGTTMAQPALIGLAIDDGIRAGNAGVLTVAALVFLGVTLGQAGGTAVQLVVNADLGQRMLQAMRMEMFRKYQALPLGFYDRQITGRLIGRMASDVEQVGEAVTEGAIGAGGRHGDPDRNPGGDGVVELGIDADRGRSGSVHAAERGRVCSGGAGGLPGDADADIDAERGAGRIDPGDAGDPGVYPRGSQCRGALTR